MKVTGCAARKADPRGVAFFGQVHDSSCLFYNHDVDPNHLCISVLLRAGAGLSQVVVVAMTLFKLVVGRRGGWGRTPLTSLMLKQGLVTFFIVLGKYTKR